MSIITSGDLNIYSNLELRDYIVELKHNIVFLEKSQQELSEALKSEPDDPDFTLAIEQNVETIGNKRLAIQKIEDHLIAVDPAFCLQYTESHVAPSTTHLPAMSESIPRVTEEYRETDPGIFL